MGTRANLYAGQPNSSGTTLVASGGSTVTQITRAWAKNTGTTAQVIEVTMNGVVVEDDFVLGPGESKPVLSALGTLNALQSLVMAPTTSATVNVVIDGYQVT